MPRHPPCALCSLSHKHSTKTTTPDTPKGIERRGLINCVRPTQKTRQTTHAVRLNNCSTNQRTPTGARQMLASTVQQPNTTPTNTPTTPTGAASAKEATKDIPPPPSPFRERSSRVIPQDPTVCHHHPPEPAGQVPRPPTPTRRAEQTVLRPTTHRGGPSSTIPLANTTMRGQTLADHRDVCSLERR